MEVIRSGLKALEDLHEELATDLPKIKAWFGLHGDTSSDSCKDLHLLFPRLMKVVNSLELDHGRLDFDYLEPWLNHLGDEISKRKELMQQLSRLEDEHGINLSTLSSQDLETADLVVIMEKVASKSPFLKLMQSCWGPNWLLCRDMIQELSGFTNMPPEKRIPLKTLKTKIDAVANEIFNLWETLRRPESQDSFRSFRAQWCHLDPQARSRWLQQFSGLHRRPDSAILILAGNSKEASAQKPFLSPLLNIEDLAQADVLPDFIQNRSAIHPKAFLFADSRFVALGYWHRLLTNMHTEGRISFFSETDVNAENSPYGIQFEPDAFKNLHLINPVTGYHSLVAQKETYKFLVSCLLAPMEPSVDSTTSSGGDNQAQPLSILSLSARLQYGRPDHIAWKNLRSIPKASADEALDDLWQLRNDAEYWNMRFSNMQRRTSSFLRSVFGRIDVLQAVYGKLRSCRTDYQTRFGDDSSVVKIRCDDAQIKDTIYMHSVFRSILNEMLSSIEDHEWLRRNQENETLRYLFHLMAENHPTIRLIGLGTILRTIDREISDGNCQEAIPLPIAQALHDMSVVAACMQETSKHYNLLSCLDENYARLANDATSDWQEHERPWLRLIQGFLVNVQCRETEINRQARNDNDSLEDRHRQFWNTIDDCMLLWNNHNPIVRMILNQAPVPRASVQSSTLWEASWDSPDASPMPTATQKRKSRKRQLPKVSPPPSLVTILSAEDEPRIRPNVYITEKRDIEYWDLLRNSKGQQEFKSWVSFLSHIGFRWKSEWGSIHIFELKGLDGEDYKILYHAPHGQSGGKVPHGPARGLWVTRLEKHFNVIISEKGTVDNFGQ